MNKIFESGILTIFIEPNQFNIKEVKFNTEGLCHVISTSNILITEYQTICTPAYNYQYDIPITKDGKLMFIGSWEKGLYCYDIITGKSIWNQKSNKIRNIILADNELIVEVCDKGIYKRDIEKGNILSEIKMKNIQFLYPISPYEIFTGYIKNNYFIYEIPNLIMKYQIPEKLLNPSKAYSFNILDATMKDDKLSISGWEQYRNKDTKNNEVFNFERVIELP